jgi:SpoVK/Ycf46/Vps4 family AAA+-type ATPase
MLPSELLRRGRFDEMFFIDLPSSKERMDILALYMRKYLRLNFTGPLAERLVELSEGFTGADLESTVRDLAYRQISNPKFILNEQALLTAFNNVVPLSQTSPEKIEAIREWGRTRAVPASGRPIGEDKLSQRQGPKTRKVLLSNN